MVETALNRLVEAAIRATGNDDIQHLDTEDVTTRVTAVHAGSMPSQYILEKLVYPEKFVDNRSRYMDQNKISCDDGGCIPANEAYDRAMKNLNDFLMKIKPGHLRYDDFLEVFTDKIAEAQRKETPDPNDFRVLGAYTEGQRINHAETWMEVGAGYNSFRLIEALNQHPDKKDIHLILVDNDKKCVCDPAEAYAKRLGLEKKVTVVHADAGGKGFQLKLMSVLGDKRVDKIRENQMFICLHTDNKKRRVDLSVKNFLNTCHWALQPRGTLIVREHENFAAKPGDPKLLRKNRVKEIKHDGYVHHMKVNVLDHVDGKFQVVYSKLEKAVPRIMPKKGFTTHRVTKLRKPE